MLEEYITEFKRAKSRLMAETSIKNDYFYTWSFISGLKEELQTTINLFKPQNLNEAFNVAQEVEMAVGPSDKKPLFLRPQNTIPVRPIKPPDSTARRWPPGPQTHNQSRPPPRPQQNPQQNLTIDQKRNLGLCFRCNEKWFQGHRCNKGLHTMGAVEGEDEDVEIDEILNYEDKTKEEVEDEQEESVVISLNGPKSSNNKTITYKGSIN
jgi:hypothetical protein